MHWNSKLQAKMQNHLLFSSNNIYFCKCQKADEKEQQRGRANFEKLKLSFSPFASKMSVSTNQLH